MRKLTPLLIFFLLTALNAYSQKSWELGAEYMRPIGKGFNGSIAGPRFESYKNKSSFSMGLTYHFSSKKSYSVSKGFGIYAGYRLGFGTDLNGSNPFAGVRVLFSLENFEGKTNLNSLMVTPMVEIGYHYVSKKNIFATGSVGGGYTFKRSKDYNSLNEDEGGRIIPAIAAGYRF